MRRADVCLTSWLSFLPLQLLNHSLSPPMAWRRVARAQQKGKIALGDGFTPELSELLDNRSEIFQVFQIKGKFLRAKSAKSAPPLHWVTKFCCWPIPKPQALWELMNHLLLGRGLAPPSSFIFWPNIWLPIAKPSCNFK